MISERLTPARRDEGLSAVVSDSIETISTESTETGAGRRTLSINETLMVHRAGGVFDGIVRVLAISSRTRTVGLMRLDTVTLRAPLVVALSDLQSCLQNGTVVRVQEFSQDIAVSEDELTPKDREELTRIENLMLPLIENDWDSLVFDPVARGSLLANRADEMNVHVRTARRHLYAYFWGGMTRFAFIGSAKRNTVGQHPGTKARGGRKDGPALPEIREQLIDGARKYYLNGKHTMREAFTLTKKKHFRRQEGRIASDRVLLSEILKPDSELPTFRQFRYVCELQETETGKRLKKPGSARVPKENKKLTGRSRDGVLGPGYRFEIDATRFQVHLTSQFGRRFMVGEAIVYGVIDVWSGAYVGHALSINPPSWEIARAALLNCFTDKGDMFKRLGLPYTSADWPACELPSRLAADRGELLGRKAGVVPELGIKLEIMPSMCPESKGKVESQFNSLKHGNHFYHLPGSHAKNPGRREDDGKKTSALTTHELERIVVEIFLDLNNEPVPVSQMPAEAIAAGWETITHIGLYKWGLEHRPGYTRTLPPKDVFAGLLTKAKASATSRAITFRNQTFRSSALVQLGYDSNAKPIDIGFDAHCASRVWFYDSAHCIVIPAENENEDIRRHSATFAEAEMLIAQAQMLYDQAKEENIHRRSEKAKRINRPTHLAILEANAERRSLGKGQAKAEIRANQEVERMSERYRRADQMLEQYGPSNSESEPLAMIPIEVEGPAPKSVNLAPRPIADIINDAWRNTQ